MCSVHEYYTANSLHAVFVSSLSLHHTIYLHAHVCMHINTDTGMFVCTPEVQSIPIALLCDGDRNCDNGDDETTTLCESELIHLLRPAVLIIIIDVLNNR